MNTYISNNLRNIREVYRLILKEEAPVYEQNTLYGDREIVFERPLGYHRHQTRVCLTTT